MTRKTKILIGWAALAAAVAVGLWLGRTKPVYGVWMDNCIFETTNQVFEFICVKDVANFKVSNWVCEVGSTTFTNAIDRNYRIQMERGWR